MTPQIAATLIILGLAVVLFITERLRIDLVALLVLGSLALAGLVTPTEALSGFSNPAVVTVWAVFILSGGLSRTGVANLVGLNVMLHKVKDLPLRNQSCPLPRLFSTYQLVFLPCTLGRSPRPGHPPNLPNMNLPGT